MDNDRFISGPFIFHLSVLDSSLSFSHVTFEAFETWIGRVAWTFPIMWPSIFQAIQACSVQSVGDNGFLSEPLFIFHLEFNISSLCHCFFSIMKLLKLAHLELLEILPSCWLAIFQAFLSSRLCAECRRWRVTFSTTLHLPPGFQIFYSFCHCFLSITKLLQLALVELLEILPSSWLASFQTLLASYVQSVDDDGFPSSSTWSINISSLSWCPSSMKLLKLAFETCIGRVA